MSEEHVDEYEHYNYEEDKYLTGNTTRILLSFRFIFDAYGLLLISELQTCPETFKGFSSGTEKDDCTQSSANLHVVVYLDHRTLMCCLFLRPIFNL
ncbi:hypothetical protein JTE90_025865 [Oedothorax gibbosus]|uniref:Uncharacterized protein n=1 Tax=Oedothorax gibbosus TaxID=931172 RepID=A0AAV6UN58_9ARAC|nr:hypothetical protein JTE90_025865 [Oedothorax gibbosus]